MNFASPNGELPNNNNEAIKINGDNNMKNNEPIDNDENVFQIEYEETLSKTQQAPYQLKKEGAYSCISFCFKDNIKIFFIR